MLKIIDKSIDFIFSDDKRKYIILLFIIGLTLRILISLGNPFAADEMLHAPHALGFIDSGKLQIMDQDAIWFFLTDLITKIFGATVFGIRFLQVLFDSLLIILVFLLGKEIFNDRIGLIASIIYTFSSLLFIQMKALMDIPMSFFVFLSMYLLILFFKKNKNKFFILSWISLGIAIMIKQIALWFIPAFVLFSLYYNKKHNNSFKLKQVIYAGIIIIIMVIPVLTFNYLLYKDKGIVDLQFARFTKISFETYEGIAHTIQPFNLKHLLLPYDNQRPGIIQGASRIYRFESIITVLFFILGIFFLFMSKNRFTFLLTLSFLFPFLFLSGTSTLMNHFVFTVPFVSMLASLSILKISDKFSQEKFRKYFIYLAIILIIILSFVNVYKYTNGFFAKHEIGKLIDFKIKNIEENSLVIVDSRIYRGRIVLMFWDRHYLESNFFPTLIQGMDSLPGEGIPLTTYYIEAVTDDSGWGTVKDQPEFNQSSENIADYFKQNSQLIKTIDDPKNQPHFNVYKIAIMAKPASLNYADSTHVWFYYPVGYKPKGSSFDDYSTYNAFDSLLDKLAHLILYLEVLTTILLAFYLFYLLYKSS